MVNYRRNRVRNGTYALTITLRDRRSLLLVERMDALLASWRRARRRVPHRVVAFVVLPDHIHALVTMKDGRDDYSRLIQDFKKGFTRRVSNAGSPWQSRFWEHTIRDEYDFGNHVAYIHHNPVKHGWCKMPIEWRYSSIHRPVWQLDDRGTISRPSQPKNDGIKL
jgi:putative transposase